MRPQGLGRPQGRHSEFTLSAAGAARVNFGVYYLPGQLQYRQPPAVLAQYLRQSLLNGTFVNVNLVQQVLAAAVRSHTHGTSISQYAVHAPVEEYRSHSLGGLNHRTPQWPVNCRRTSTTSQGTAACCWPPSTTPLPCASPTAPVCRRRRRCRRHPGDAVVQPSCCAGCALDSICQATMLST